MAVCNRQTPIPLGLPKSSLLDKVHDWMGDCMGKWSDLGESTGWHCGRIP